jgi:hypothetical protein
VGAGKEDIKGKGEYPNVNLRFFMWTPHTFTIFQLPCVMHNHIQGIEGCFAKALIKKLLEVSRRI